MRLTLPVVASKIGGVFLAHVSVNGNGLVLHQSRDGNIAIVILVWETSFFFGSHSSLEL